MTTENRLAKSEKQNFVSKFTALEWARMAGERGNTKAQSAWLAEARRRGEIPDHSEPR